MQLVEGTFITTGENSLASESSPVLFGGSEILNPLCCLGDQNFWILSCVLGGSEILNPLLCCLGGQKFWILSCVLGGSEILNPRLCCLGGQKFWISCVWGIRITKYSPVFLGDQKFWISCVVWGIRNSESSPVLFRGQKFWIYMYEFSPVFLGHQKVRILARFLWGTSRDKKFRKSFNCLNLK